MTESLVHCEPGSSIATRIKESGGIDEFVRGVHKLFVLNLSLGVYMGITGLVLCTLFYVFKTSDPTIMTRHRVRKIRLILFLILLCTIFAVAGIIFTFGNLLEFYAVPSALVCDNNTFGSAIQFGFVVTFLGLLSGLYLMS